MESGLRPESRLIRNMSESGFPWVQTSVVEGVHDFEQYYRDLYRKVLLQSKKFRRYMGIIQKLWTKRARRDPDYCIALKALDDAKELDPALALDAGNMRERAERAVESAQLNEKGMINVHEWKAVSPDRLIRRTRTAFSLRKMQSKLSKPSVLPAGAAEARESRHH